jgi:hypothetical protein
MVSQDNGFSKPSLSLGQQNPVDGWQPAAQAPIPSGEVNQSVSNSQSLNTSNSLSSQSGLTYPVPLQANDSDLVEREWVDAAKRIMDTYRSDPYNKNRALTFLRADYIKKRYNKDIKIPEN